jgi:mono/diheme cytochrome c family protein
MRSAALALLVCLAGVGSAAADATRGEYLVKIMDCGGCHTPGYLLGKAEMDRFVGGGNVGFQIPELGIFYPPNLTPDEETGLGKWSKADIIKAVRTGVRPDGRVLVPIMPYHSYAALSDEDADSLASYLQSLKPIKNKVPPPSGPTEKAPGPYMTVVMP